MSRDSKSTYYDAGGIEVFDVIRAKLTPEQFRGFLLGSVIKYSLRMMHKTPHWPRRDAEKAAFYAKRLEETFPIEEITKEKIGRREAIQNAHDVFNEAIEKHQKAVSAKKANRFANTNNV